jgi:hypothetical protein
MRRSRRGQQLPRLEKRGLHVAAARARQQATKAGWCQLLGHVEHFCEVQCGRIGHHPPWPRRA